MLVRVHLEWAVAMSMVYLATIDLRICGGGHKKIMRQTQKDMVLLQLDSDMGCQN